MNSQKHFSLTVIAVGAILLPIFCFILFSYIVYPLSPHCTLGRGLLGCTPMCEVFGNGYKEVPCFHEDPLSYQLFSFHYPYMYYLPVILIFGFLSWRFGLNNVMGGIEKIAILPLTLFRANRKNHNLFSRMFVILSLLPITVEWLFGYIVLIKMILNATKP